MKLIENYDYYVTKDGAIISVKTNKEICQWVDNVGYKQCILFKEGKRTYKRVHRLVAEAFLENPNGLKIINHIDGCKTNNNLNNLEWTTNSANTKHGYDNDLYKNTYKTDCMVDGVVYRSVREASEKSGYNRKTLTAILKGQKKNNYGVEIKYV